MPRIIYAESTRRLVVDHDRLYFESLLKVALNGALEPFQHVLDALEDDS